MRLDGHLPQWGVAPGDEARATEAALALLIELLVAARSGAPPSHAVARRAG
jgi:hypothetical protein